MAIRYNTSPGGDFPVLPEGTFELEIKGVKQSVSKNGHQQLEVDFVVAEGELAGQKHREWVVITEKSGFRLDLLAEAAGVSKVDTGEVDPEGNPILELEESHLVGKFVRADVTQREWEGKLRASIKKYHPSGLNAASEAPKSAASKPAATQAATPAAQPATGTPGAGAAAPRRPRPASAS